MLSTLYVSVHNQKYNYTILHWWYE